MADGDRTNMIDGFASVQAVRRVKPKGGDPKFAPSRTRLPASEKKPSESNRTATAAHIGRTALPPRFDIHCYACGYRFVQTGRMGESVLCPKCRERLLTKDYELTGIWSDPVRTVGTILIAQGAVLDAVDIEASRVRVAADPGKARIACQSLHLELGGKLEFKSVAFRDLTVEVQARASFSRVMACRRLTVKGCLTAKIRAEESVAVLSGGLLRGDIKTPRLIMEDGARLSARLAIGAQG